MKKILGSFLAILVLSLTSVSFAAEKIMTVGEVLTMYFTELFPETTQDINDVIIKYNGIGNRSGLRTALQKAVYYGILPNSPVDLTPDRLMSDRAFVALLKRDFGVRLSTDDTLLTVDDYEGFMSPLRTSAAYQALQKLNLTTDQWETVPVESIASDARFANSDNYYLLEKIYSILQDNYYGSDKFNKAELIYGAVEGLVNELGDQYTRFFRPDASTDFKNTLDGNIVGIGVIVDVDARGSLLVTDVVRHSPAEKAGIVAGDRIIKIGGITVTTEDGIGDDIAILRGEKGTKVDVTILSDKITKVYTITREVIQMKLVETEVLSNSFRITFGEVAFGSDGLFRAALEEFLESGKKRLILDLRNNPGGSMAETRSILNFFIDKSNPLIILQYPKVKVTNYATDNAMTDWSKYEIIILVNRDTASAAEIIASTLREYFPIGSRIIGEKTYGKGTVQELVSFDDKSLLKYTIARWLTGKNGISYDKVGIQPDQTSVFDIQLWKTKRIDSQLLAGVRYEFSRN